MKALKYIVAIVLLLSLTVPALAGKGPGGPGGGGDIPDTGELYGDLYVILRDVDGVPILDQYGCIQPISTTDGEDPVSGITATADEPFTLYSYYDSEDVWTECELTEEMATWVEGVDFGRLNLGRSPESVIAHAFDEAIKKMNVATAMKLDPAGRLVLTLVDAETGELVDKTIDAPAENLALYIKMMTDGDWITENTEPVVKGGPPEGKGPPEGDGPSSEERPVLNESAIALLSSIGFDLGDPEKTTAALTSHELTLAASLLAAAADKVGSITLDKVIYINSVYGINQAGSLPGEVEGKAYFDFTAYGYDRGLVYANRSSGDCSLGWVWVLQPDLEPDHFYTTCMEILGFEAEHDPLINSVRFTDMAEAYTTVFDEFGNPLTYGFNSNVRAFTQAADDALQVIEYIHNYKVPEVLYP